MSADSPERSRRGRKRDRSKDVAVLEATIELLATTGIVGTTMDRVAAEAGVSKVTVYTRWASKTELVGAALTHLQFDQVEAPSGAVRADLVAHLEAFRRQYDEVGGMAIVGHCLAEEPQSGELLAIIRASTHLPRRERLATVLRDGIARGELEPGLDVERGVSMLLGSLYADHIAGRSLGPGWAEGVVDAFLAGRPGRPGQDRR